MKLLYGNGRVLEARDVGPVLVRFVKRPDGPPIRFNGYRVLEDAAARAILEEARETNLYERET